MRRQYGPSESQLSRFLSEKLGLEVDFLPVPRADVDQAIEAAGIRRLEIHMDGNRAPTARQAGGRTSPTALLGELAQLLGGSVTVTVTASGREGSDYTQLTRQAREFAREYRRSPAAQAAVGKARFRLEPDADFAGDAMLDLIRGVVVYEHSVETDRASGRYLDQEDVRVATVRAHREVEGYLHP